MRQTLITLVCAAAAVMLGCVPSLQPLVTDKDAIFEPGLLGTWTKADSKQSFIFTKADDGKSYNVLATDDEGDASKLEARLMRLGNDLFLDTTVKELDWKGNFAKFHLLPAHLFTKITLEGDTLCYATLNFDWVKPLCEKKKLTLSHDIVNDMIVLTAPTNELQDFVRKHAAEKDVFQSPTELKRKK
jgi:hypothetical protein